MKPGTKVRCVRANGNTRLKQGEIYTVIHFEPNRFPTKGGAVNIKELPGGVGFYANRFEPVSSIPFDIGTYGCTRDGYTAHVTAIVTKKSGTSYRIGFIQSDSGFIAPMLWGASGQASVPNIEEYQCNLLPPAPGEWVRLTRQRQEAAEKLAKSGLTGTLLSDAMRAVTGLTDVSAIIDHLKK